MVSLDCRSERVEGVTLVELIVETDRPHRVRIENRLDGPVWPPRQRGVPVEGWDRSGFGGVVTPDATALGYATPAEPAEPAAELLTVEPVEEAAPGRPVAAGHVERSGGDVDGDGTVEPAAVPDVDPTPAGVLRALGDPVVPRDAVPAVGGTGPNGPADGTVPCEPADGTAGSGVRDGRSEPIVGGSGGRDGPTAPTDCGTERTNDDGPCDAGPMAGPGGEDAALTVPWQVRAWLRDVETRLDAFDDGRSTDSPAGQSPLAAAVAADRSALRHVAGRADALARRAVADPGADER